MTWGVFMTAPSPTLVTPEWVQPRICSPSLGPSGMSVIPGALFLDVS